MLTREYRLRLRRDFNRVYRRGQSIAVPAFVLYRWKNGGGVPRLGFSVSKKIGKAVVRNRIKRRFRAAVREEFSSFDAGYDYIFVVRRAALDMDYAALRAAIVKGAVAAGRKH